MRILVIDDDPEILGLVKLFLDRSEGHDAVCATSAKDALEAIADAEVPFDCFLVDVQMPSVDGISLVRMVRQTPGYGDTPILMLTAMRDKRHLDEAFRAGATDYVGKPFDFQDLLRRLQAAQALSLEKALRRDRPLMAGEFRHMPDEPKDFRFGDPLALTGVDAALDYAEFENYVRQVRLRRDAGPVALAVKIGQAPRFFDAYTSDAFRALVVDCAKAIQEIVLREGGVVSYRGNGTFLCVLEKTGRKDSRRALQRALSARLSGRHPEIGGVAPDLVAGDVVSLDTGSTAQALDALASAVDTAAAYAAARGSFLEVPRRLLTRQRLSDEERHLERRSYEALLKESSIAPDCSVWTSSLTRRRKALRGR